jgi:hypothetical protein
MRDELLVVEGLSIEVRPTLTIKSQASRPQGGNEMALTQTQRSPQLEALPWPAQPVVHEVNTAVWLGEVGRRIGSPVTLDAVPQSEWDNVVPPGVNVVWLMGVWERSAAGRAIALDTAVLRAAWSAALPGWTDADVAGSPYCIRDYVPDSSFGNWSGIDRAREQLHARGALLMVDWVPNHVGPDSRWLESAPDAFVRGTAEELAQQPGAFVGVGGEVFARAKDPYFAPWPDVVQVNAFAPSLRKLARTALARVAEHADAVRCDMAMLMLDDVVTATWGERVGAAPARTYWQELVEAATTTNPQFTFVAEAYWDREWDLLQQGFQHCYDKRLYDRLTQGDPALVRGHLDAELAYQRRLVRFLENHDEPRAALSFAPREREKACAVAVATLPGLTLWHEGQADGREVFVPVFLRRRPDEPLDPDLAAWYHRLWAVAADIREGEWSRRDVVGWPDNNAADRLVAWTWSRASAADGVFSLVVVNLGSEPSDGLVRVDHSPAAGQRWRLTDQLDGTSYERDGDDLATHGLYVARPGWGVHVLLATPVSGWASAPQERGGAA